MNRQFNVTILILFVKNNEIRVDTFLHQVRIKIEKKKTIVLNDYSFIDTDTESINSVNDDDNNNDVNINEDNDNSSKVYYATDSDSSISSED